ncbi:MAG: branched-chain amino acid ABC transporter permease [Firmicutes bacterium]|nr:branched-chain amino acid ABC transporter permease [Bacillota bacterium]
MFLQQLINGVTLGSTYALIALGYTMVYGIILLINFAHGEIYMVGSFIALILVVSYKVNIVAAFFAAMLGCMILGVLMERIAYRPLRHKNSNRLSALISAIGVSIFLSNLVLMLRGPQTTRFPDVIEYQFYSIGPAQISNLQILIIVISAALMLGLQYIVMRTKVGKAMRATSMDMQTAYLMGINVNRIVAITFAIGSSLGAAAGVLVGIYFNAVSPLMGTMAGMKAFTAAVLGGIGSIPGAMLGGVLLGVAEVLGVAYLSSSYRDAIAFGILIIILLIKPSGILGQRALKKV